MQVHTFIADSANEAVEQIRRELGPAAVVLSVRKLPRAGFGRLLKHDQIEVLASIEPPTESAQIPLQNAPDPLTELREEIRQLRQQVTLNVGTAARHVGQTSGLPVRGTSGSANSHVLDRKPSTLAHILTQTGLLPQYSELILQELPGSSESLPISEQINLASDLLLRRWRGEPPTSEAGVHIFVGVPGAGKSAVLCKMLAQTSLVEGQPATVYQLDSHITNASPQPTVYSEIIGSEFIRTVPLNFERREESVYIDVPGVLLHDTKALAQLQELIPCFGTPQIHLVLNAAYESAHLLEQARFFSTLGIADLIVTHLDEETRWGKLWNLVFGTNYSLHSFSAGQNVPGEFHPAHPEAILSRQFRGK
jgi:flagellar biosynthesis protein FlhF